jgi:hypothetical protein
MTAAWPTWSRADAGSVGIAPAALTTVNFRDFSAFAPHVLLRRQHFDNRQGAQNQDF